MNLSRRLVITFGIFVMLGMPEGVLGTSWPDMRADLGRAESNLSVLLGGYIIGYLVSTIGSGQLSHRLGPDRLTQVGLIASVGGMGLYAVAVYWPIAIFAAFVLGCGAGLVDSTLNAEVALRYGQREMHFLHACFGIGATLGPLLVVAVLGLNQSFRLAWVVLIVLELGHLAAFATSRRTAGGALAEENAVVIGSSRRPNLVLGATLAYFALYVSAEASLGQWSFSVLTEDRGVSNGLAGLAVSGYWGGLTVGRLLLAGIAERLSPLALLRGAMVVSVVGIIWFAADVGPSAFALPLVGLAFAGIFPSLVLSTPGWIGSERVAHAVGYQLAASSAGAAAAALVFYFVVGSFGLGAVPIGVTCIVIGMVAVHLFTESAARA